MATYALTCADAKKIDLVDYLTSLVHHPQKFPILITVSVTTSRGKNGFL